jgi:hypothetical protein
MTNNISFKVDTKTGVIEVAAPPEHFQEVMTGVKELLEIAKTLPLASESGREEATSNENGTTSSADAANQKTGMESTVARRSRPGGSASRPGRIGSFEPVEFGLKEENERRLRQFYAEKKPKEQSHQVAVAMYQGEKALNRKAFSYNEIYTLLRLSGEKELPKALDVVIARMLTDNWVIREKDGIALKFVGRDFVEASLPLPAE